MRDEPDSWLAPFDERLKQQLRFLIEADRLKGILRGSRISDGSRKENSAEHSWHLALFAMVLAEWATGPVQVSRVVQMLLLHDLVEIDCGDTPLFDAEQARGQSQREAEAARRLFGLLPPEQALSMHELWVEFENARTADARFAKAIDRLQPVLLNHLVQGGTWLDYDVDAARESRLTRGIADGSAALWEVAQAVFADATAKGWLRPAPPG